MADSPLKSDSTVVRKVLPFDDFDQTPHLLRLPDCQQSLLVNVIGQISQANLGLSNQLANRSHNQVSGSFSLDAEDVLDPTTSLRMRMVPLLFTFHQFLVSAAFSQRLQDQEFVHQNDIKGLASGVGYAVFIPHRFKMRAKQFPVDSIIETSPRNEIL